MSSPQAQIVTRKKEHAAESLNEARQEYHTLKAELTEKQAQLKDSDSQGMLKADEVGTKKQNETNNYKCTWTP